MYKKMFFLIMLIFGLSFQIISVNAQTWSATTRLTWDPEASLYPAVAICAFNNPYVIWEKSSYPGVIFFKRAVSGGTAWLAAKRLTWGISKAFYSHLAVDSNNNPHAVWADIQYGNAEIIYRNSTDAGINWGVKKRLTWNFGDSRDPRISIGPNDQIHIVWADNFPGNYEIYYKQSADNGKNWHINLRLTWNPGPSSQMSLAVNNNNNPYIAWCDATPGNQEIFFKKSSNGGISWTPPVRLTWNSSGSWLPWIAVNNNNIHIVWSDNPPPLVNKEIYYKKSTDGGSTWSAIKRITWNTGISDNSKIVLGSGGNPYIVWVDWPSVSLQEIFFRYSTDKGTTWGATKRLTWNIGSSINPDLAIDSNNDLHLVWIDDTPGNSEIFYKSRK